LSLDAKTPVQQAKGQSTMPRPIANYLWKSHYNGLFQTLVAVQTGIRMAHQIR